nr:DNA-formamidopyrimidine glycosylase family protein [Janibacter alkaliphilus]
MAGQAVGSLELASFTVLKTVDPPPQALAGAPVDAVRRHGKWLDIDCDGTHLVLHLARAGWIRWSDSLPSTPVRPGKGPVALRLRLADGAGFDLTEAGTKKSVAAYLVRDVTEVPRIATLGPDPLAEDFTREALAGILAGRRTQVKGVLRDQSIIAGIGNAYSDEILHVARLSPFALAGGLDDEAVDRLHSAIRSTLVDAVAASAGKPAKELKDAKRSGMRVHGRTGEACTVCGDVVREVSFADSSLQYCATCQTDGKPLADRRTSRFLK